MSKQTLTQKDLDLIKDLIDVEVEEKLDNRFEQFEKKFGPKQDKVITMLQELMGEIQKEREENEILDDRSKTNRDRIEALETHVGLASV